MEPFVVGYDRKGLQKVVRSCLPLALMGLGLTAIGFLDRDPDGVNLRVMVFLAQFFGPAIVVGTMWLASMTSRRKALALIVAPEGLVIKFLPRTRIELPWSDVAGVERRTQYVRDRNFETLVVRVRDETAFAARLRGEARQLAFLAKLSGTPIATISLSLLDKSWTEISAAVEKARVTDGPQITVLRQWAKEFAEQHRNRRTHDGALMTLQDYEQTFRRGPIGYWDTTEYGASPMDSAVSFCEDGSAWASHGVGMVGGFGEALRWRPRPEEFAFEVARNEEGAHWHGFIYRFVKKDGEVLLQINPSDDEESDQDEGSIEEDFEDDPDDWIGTLIFGSFPYRGPC